jgi:hypothetical protein
VSVRTELFMSMIQEIEFPSSSYSAATCKQDALGLLSYKSRAMFSIFNFSCTSDSAWKKGLVEEPQISLDPAMTTQSLKRVFAESQTQLQTAVSHSRLAENPRAIPSL